ncbi:CDP-glycerol glycerophosphotransferase family protein [Ekhidna sp.]|uniref:CDP-glycerol glycerophosphotransferase family protein n=1 Tax=Ekhidna sp. TaxID=2608089 RepID=UPI003CCC1903
MKKIRSIFNSGLKVFRPILYLLYLFSFLSKRDVSIWSFGGDYNSFSNGKYLAKYIRKQNKGIRIVWLVRRNIDINKIRKDGFEAYYQWSLNGIKLSLKAKYQFLNSYVFDINYWLSGGSIITNLWHGVPLKKLNYDIKSGPSAKLFNPKYLPRWFMSLFILRLKSSHYFLATSEMTKEMFSRSFKVEKEKCIICGYPRNDSFFTSENDALPQYIQSKYNSDEKLIIYMPTWRDSGNDFLTDSKIDFSELNKICVKEKYKYFIKLHPLTSIDTSIFEKFSHIHLLPNNLDVYPFLNEVHCLITDYSSIYIDFLLTNKPIIFYPFDLEKYSTQDRDLYFDYSSVTPGPKATNSQQLMKEISRLGRTEAEYLEKYNHEEVKEMFWKFHDGKSSERIYNFFSNMD